jgi:hypothetical protein
MDIINRVISAATLDGQFFNEVESDNSLNTEALLVVILVSVAGGIGAFIDHIIWGKIGAALLALLVTFVIMLVSYYIWAYVIFFIGTNLFEGRADPGELLRVLGYASGPRILSVLGFVPCLGAMISFAGAIWALIAGFIGVREALDLDTGKTLVTVIVGWAIIIGIELVVSKVFGIGALGLGVLF